MNETIEDKTLDLRLSKKSKKLVILRVVILVLFCIYVPIHSVFSQFFSKIELEYVFEKLEEHIPTESLNGFYQSNIFSLIITGFGSKENTMLFSSLIYHICHPFIAMKLILVTHSVIYFIVLTRCVLQSYRPFWTLPQKVHICHLTYADPPIHFFNVSFYYFYFFLSFYLVNKNNQRKIARTKKIGIFTILITLALLYGFLLIIHRSSFLYQLNVAFTLSLIIIVVLMQLETKIHNFILNSLKSIYKTRKYKIRILIIVLLISFIGITLYNFIPQDGLNDVQQNLLKNNICSESKLVNFLGMQATFLDSAYIFGIIGAFWGVSLTVEKTCHKWWGKTKITNTLIKIAFTFMVGEGMLLFFSKY